MGENNVEENTNNQSNAVNTGDSILASIRKLVSSGDESSSFDVDLIIHINTVLSILQQLGVGPVDGYSIVDDTATWSDYLGADSRHVNLVKSYMAAKVRILFDPPVSSAVLESLNRVCSEFEWRANVAAENKDKEESENESDSDDT